MYMHMYIVVSSSTGSRHLACNYGKEGIFPSLQPKVGKQVALNPKKRNSLKGHVEVREFVSLCFLFTAAVLCRCVPARSWSGRVTRGNSTRDVLLGLQ